MRNFFLFLGLVGQAKSGPRPNRRSYEASEPIECACAAPSHTGISFSWYSSVEIRNFPDYERLGSQFCSLLREALNSCGSNKLKRITYEELVIHIDCEATCGSGAEVVEQFNSGWLGLIAILVGVLILVCLCRNRLNLCSKYCSETPEESSFGLDRSTLFSNDSS